MIKVKIEEIGKLKIKVLESVNTIYEIGEKEEIKTVKFLGIPVYKNTYKRDLEISDTDIVGSSSQKVGF